MKYLPFVNTKQGSKSCDRFSAGNTLPFTQLPFAMAGFVPQTSIGGQPWFFHPDHHSLEGVRLTHQPSVWLLDYGTFLMMPQTGESPQNDPKKYWSSYRPREAVLAPDYLRLDFARYNVLFELAPTERGGFIRLSYRDDCRPYFSILPLRGEYGFRLDIQDRRLYGYTTGHGMDKAENFRMYFIIQFSDDVLDETHTKVFSPDEAPSHGLAVQGEGSGIHVAFSSREVAAQIAISYISEEQAILNLRQEQTLPDFDVVQANANRVWEERLSAIEVETEMPDQMRTFYSCLYRSLLFPHKCYEIDAGGKAVHYSPGDGKIHAGLRYTDTGFWDSSRTQFPLLSIIAREDYAQMLEGFVQDYKDSGWLPRWPSIGENGCMPSTHIDAVIADAAVKGIASRELLETAFEGMQHHANTESEDKRFGRSGVSAYLKYGYIPYDVEDHSVNRTMDDAYGDYCIAQVANVLGYPDLEAIYLKRAQNYKNLFDPSTGFMRGKDSQKHMREDLDPFDWGGDYCEGSAWQNSFYVPHDIKGLTELHGGKEVLAAKLDDLFTASPRYNPAAYGGIIHEMVEMAEVDFGQCAISNQPSFHIPFLYAALGQPQKTDYWVEKICRELFSFEDNGFPGDEDNGSMAAWYIFGMLGLYPLCPGKPEFIKSRMLVKSAKIHGQKWSNEGLGTYISYMDIPAVLSITD